MVRLLLRMVEHPAAWTAKCSSPKFTVISCVCTTPLFRSEKYLRQKYEQEHLSARQIAVLIQCSHSAVNAALIQFGIKRVNQRSGWTEYGWKFKQGKRVMHFRQQLVIRQMIRWHERGWTNSHIAMHLNTRKIPSPSGKGNWHGTTINRILSREKK